MYFSAAVLVECSRNFDALKTLDLVANFDVIVILDANTAFGAGSHFINVIFEAPQ